MTDFSFEVPINHLLDFDDLQDFHLALSMHCGIAEYRIYFLNKALEGKKEVWLDNSFNEMGEPDDPKTLIEYYRLLHADKVFAPDSMDWGKTELAKAYVEMTSFVPPGDVIVVVKSKDELEWLQRCKAKHFAIPFRYRMTKSFDELQWCKSYHFLGMNTIEEIKELNPPSLDTSFPIRMAIMGLSLRDWIKRGQPRLWHKDMPNYYNMVLTTEQLLLARDNIKQLKEACHE